MRKKYLLFYLGAYEYEQLARGINNINYSQNLNNKKVSKTN